MDLATLANLKPPLIQILNANRGAYSANVGTGANRNGAYPFDDEITEALLRADGHIITEGYFKSRNASLREVFLTASGNLATGAKLPAFVGLLGKVEYSLDNITFKPSQQVDSKADIIGAYEAGSYVAATAFAGIHHIPADEAVVYHASPYLRVNYPVYERTAELQAFNAHDAAILAWAIAFLYKDRSQAGFDHYVKLADFLLSRIIDGSMQMSSYMPQAMSGGVG
jgi:hypothetical protein